MTLSFSVQFGAMKTSSESEIGLEDKNVWATGGWNIATVKRCLCRSPLRCKKQWKRQKPLILRHISRLCGVWNKWSGYCCGAMSRKWGSRMIVTVRWYLVQSVPRWRKWENTEKYWYYSAFWDFVTSRINKGLSIAKVQKSLIVKESLRRWDSHASECEQRNGSDDCYSKTEFIPDCTDESQKRSLWRYKI